MTDEFANHDEEDLAWPEKGDLLFTSGDDWWHNACLDRFPNWELYTIGYKTAADVLVEYVKGSRRDQDVLVFPVVFLYRHYLELCLKRLIEWGKELLDENPDFPKQHELDKLWHVCRPILSRLEPSIPKQDLEAIEEAIRQFCAIDPSSEAFRYPLTKKGQKSISPDVRYINLRQLAEVMEKVASFFDSASMMVSVYVDYKRDMDREFGRDFEWDY